MNDDLRHQGLLASVAAVSLLVGVLGGFFVAQRVMGDRAGRFLGTGPASLPPGHKEHGLPEQAGGGRIKTSAELDTMTGMSIKENGAQVVERPEDSSSAEGGAVTVPTVARALLGIRTAPAVSRSLVQEIRTVGIVDYDERRLTRVTLKVSGWIKDAFVNSIGRPVRQGEPLFTLYSPDLLTAQEEYLLALKAQAKVAASPLDDARANAAALVASARERLRLWDMTDEQIVALEHRGQPEPVLTVYSPSSGIVLRRGALPGTFVEPGTILYELADLTTVWIYADIYESEVALVKLNQPVSATFASYPAETFRGTVSYVYPSLNTEARTVRVRVELPNPGLKLKPGMYGNVTLHTDTVKTLVVPKEAVLDTGLRQLVFIQRGEGRYEPAPVKLGRRSRDVVEVLEGLKEGDRVVISANFLLDAESKLASASSMQAMMG
jgi:Cu(I)/Ag(I) efflux system membrane fusion protein